MTSAGL